MRLLRGLFAKQEVAEHPYSAEVMCSNWVVRPEEQPVPTLRSAALESLREADALTILARIYASQRC